MLDAVAKEFFFSEKILFLEGQEDYGLIKKFIRDHELPTNFDIFAYGSGGSANIPYLLDLAKSLGIMAGALFDKNAPGLEKIDIQSSESKILELPYDDIRDKGDSLKTGVFETNGTISEDNSIELKKILTEFINYFSY
jgi:predicted ATP-dependent endonuclease of OLD family